MATYTAEHPAHRWRARVNADTLRVGDVLRSNSNPNYMLTCDSVEHIPHYIRDGIDHGPWVRYTAHDFHKSWTRMLPADYTLTVERRG